MSNQLQITGEAKIRTIQGPVVANSGVITALNGDASQYVRGDGTLADFPTSTGGGSSVSYYLNTSVSQGTIGGVAYKQLSKTPIAGAGTDVSISADGYIASYITDANDPSLLEVPAGNFNCEFYFSVNSDAHNPYVYAEIYKYDGTTFTLLGSNVAIPEYLSNGTTLSPYYFAVAVASSVLTVTDRIAIRIYVNVDGRTVTLHTENNHLCQVVTTFSKGLISLNNLTRQNQFFATGTSGTDFAISSATATHTFNLPVASASNTGKLSSTDWSTFNGKVPYTGATANVDLGAYGLTAAGVIANNFYGVGNGVQGGYIYLKQGTTPYAGLLGSNGISADGTKFLLIANVDASNNKIALFELGSLTNNTNRTYTLPDASGTLALLSADQTFTGINSFDYGINYKTGASLANVSGYISQAYAKSGTGAGSTLSLKISDGNSVKAINLDFVGSPATYTYTFPAASGTISLLESTQTFSGTNTFGFIKADNGVLLKNGVVPASTGYTGIGAGIGTGIDITMSGSIYTQSLYFQTSAAYIYTFPAATGTLALGTGTTNYLPKFTSASTIGNSAVYDNSGNIGIGITNAVVNLQINGSAEVYSALSVGGTRYMQFGADATANYINSYNGVPLIFSTSATTSFSQKMILTSSGNLGLGVTPSAWDASWSVLQNKTSTFQNVGINTLISNNLYFGTAWKYIANGVGQLLNMNASGDYVFNTSVSGTAGANATLTPNMTLTAAGRLLLGTTTESTYLLDVNGTGRFTGQVRFGTGLYIEANGDLYQPFTGQIQISGVAGNTTYPSYGFYGDTGLGMYRESADTLAFVTSGVKALTIASTSAATFSSSVDATKGTFTSAPSLGGEQIRAYSNSGAATSYGGLLVLNSTGKGGYLTSGDNSLTTWYGGQAGYVTLAGTAGAAMKFRVDADDTKGITIATTGAATFSSSVTATSFFESSDSRLKTLIHDNYQTKGIASITPKLYTKNGKIELGYYAQDFVGVLDSAVSKGSDDMLSLSYREVLVAKVYALEQEIKKLKAKLN